MLCVGVCAGGRVFVCVCVCARARARARCVCVCVCVCVRVCFRLCVFILSDCVCVRAHTHARCVFVCVCVCARARARTYVCLCVSGRWGLMEVQLLKEALDSSHEDSFVQTSHVLTLHFAQEIRQALEFDQPSQVPM